jgi:hypothetical protein
MFHHVLALSVTFVTLPLGLRRYATRYVTNKAQR